MMIIFKDCLEKIEHSFHQLSKLFGETWAFDHNTFAFFGIQSIGPSAPRGPFLQCALLLFPTKRFFKVNDTVYFVVAPYFCKINMLRLKKKKQLQ